MGRLMTTEKFFRRFDLARDMLKEIAHSGRIGEPFDELEKSGVRSTAYDILGGIIRYPNHTYIETLEFQKRKGEVNIMGNFCYVPSGLLEDMRFAEKMFIKYSMFQVT
jgi:hypothetical protein